MAADLMEALFLRAKGEPYDSVKGRAGLMLLGLGLAGALALKGESS